MSLLDVVMATDEWLSPSDKEWGLLLVARLGRYAQDCEREAAYVLTALRRQPSRCPDCQPVLSEETFPVLATLLARPIEAQVTRIAQTADFSAGRVLFCELSQIRASGGEESRARLNKALRDLARALPREALHGLKEGVLATSDVAALFSARHQGVTYAHTPGRSA